LSYRIRSQWTLSASPSPQSFDFRKARRLEGDPRGPSPFRFGARTARCTVPLPVRQDGRPVRSVGLDLAGQC
jgi:hypothetical protein